MIDIVATDSHKLKNVTQIGTPGSEGKIYIEDTPYARIHVDGIHDRRVFVLMGHTEHADGVYTTFVEAVIPVPEIGFEGNTPIWTNRVWNNVYQEIRNKYDNLIVVGWALDMKGVKPRVTSELESIHREFFGGVHQVFYLADTSEKEEYFYENRSNHLYRKSGFYIFYQSEKRKIVLDAVPRHTEEHFRLDKNFIDEDGEREERKPTAGGGKYRRMLLEREKEPEKSANSRFPTVAVFAAAVLTAAIAGTLVMKDPAQMEKVEDIISVISQKVTGREENTAPVESTEVQIETGTEEEKYTPVEKVDGEIPKEK